MGCQHTLLNTVLEISIQMFTINLSAVRDLVVVKFESELVDNFSVIFVEELNEGLIVISNVFGGICKLSIGYEIFAVNSEIGLGVGHKCSNIEAHNLSLNLTTHAWLFFINRVESDGGVLSLPESLGSALHIATSHHNRDLTVTRVASPDVLNAFRCASLVKSSKFAS